MNNVEFYNSGQVARMFPYFHDPDYFIIGGPADGNEAQVFHTYYPNARVIGLEPNPEMLRFQVENGFPGTIWNRALWYRTTQMELKVSDNNRCGSLVNYKDVVGEFRMYYVDTISLDTLDKLSGPFERAVLWIDIEGSEEDALEGANKCLTYKQFQALNIEVNSENRDRIIERMKSFDYRMREEFDIRHMDSGRVISDLVFTL